MGHELAQYGSYQIHTFDIEGCFTNMPKDALELAMWDALATSKNKGYTGVCLGSYRGIETMCVGDAQKENTRNVDPTTDPSRYISICTPPLVRETSIGNNPPTGYWNTDGKKSQR